MTFHKQRGQHGQRLGSVALCLMLAAMATPAAARSTERETLLNRCWIEGVAKAGPEESRPLKNARGANIPAPVRPLHAFSPIEPARQGAIRRVDLKPGSRKLIALTFDMCEQPGEVAGYDGGIVDFLRDKRIKATFFMGGKWMLTHSERSQQLMADPLFEMGNHGWTHRNTRLLDGNELKDEIVRPQSAFEEIRARLGARQCVKGLVGFMGAIPQRMSLYRFPYGACNAASLAAVGNAGLMPIQWDVSSGDPAPGQTPAEISAAVTRHVRPGSIVLFHANGRGHHTAEALPGLIAKLKAQGYEFVKVSELLAAGKPVVTQSCYDHKPGDTDRYDNLVGGRGRVVPSATQSPLPPSAVPPRR